MSYATVADLRAYLKNLPAGSDVLVPATDDDPAVTVDDLLAAILGRATSIVDGALLAQDIGPFADYPEAPSDQVVYGYGGLTLLLPPHLIGSVTAVKWYDQPIPASAWRETATGQISWDTVTGAWGFAPAGWGPGPYDAPPGWGGPARGGRVHYTVTAQWGFGPAPGSIVQITLEVAVNIWRLKDQGLWQQTLGIEGTQGTLRYLGGLSTQQQKIIEALAGLPTLASPIIV